MSTSAQPEPSPSPRGFTSVLAIILLLILAASIASVFALMGKGRQQAESEPQRASPVQALPTNLPEGQTQDPLKVTEESDGKSIKVPTGGFFEIILEESPGTGYLWGKPDFDQEVFHIMSIKEFPSITKQVQIQEHVAGSTVMRAILFKVTGSGRSRITIESKRQWLTNDPTAKTFSVFVVVD